MYNGLEIENIIASTSTILRNGQSIVKQKDSNDDSDDEKPTICKTKNSNKNIHEIEWPECVCTTQ